MKYINIKLLFILLIIILLLLFNIISANKKFRITTSALLCTAGGCMLASPIYAYTHTHAPPRICVLSGKFVASGISCLALFSPKNGHF